MSNHPYRPKSTINTINTTNKHQIQFNTPSGAVFSYFIEDHPNQIDTATGNSSLSFRLEQRIAYQLSDATDYFGNWVAIQFPWMIIGAPYTDFRGRPEAGAAHCFKYNNATSSWEYFQFVYDPQDLAADYFGYTTAIYNDSIFVGASQADNNGITAQGVVVWYKYDAGSMSWVKLHRILASDGAAYDGFGYALEMQDDYMFVGAYTADMNADSVDSGAAYVFHYNGSDWNQYLKLYPNDFSAGGNFGSSIVVSGNLLVIGAPGTNINSTNGTLMQAVGAAYVFEHTGGTWVQRAKLVAPDGAEDDNFGTAVAFSGNIIAVSALYAEYEGLTNVGAVYVYEQGVNNSVWTLKRRINPPDPVSENRFGASLIMQNDALIIGSIRSAVEGHRNGAVYVFRECLVSTTLKGF